jgi:MFS superfamily sulfate permease-like transporter
MTKLDWVLVATWLAYLVFVGPWLISAPSWIAVGLGFTILVGLVVFTSKRFKSHYEKVK